jgi:integrase
VPRAYPEPFIPRQFACWVHRTSTTVKATNRRTGATSIKEEDRWDVRGKADGIQFSKRFHRAGFAEEWQKQLDRDFASGLLFDVAARRFVPPPQPEEEAPPEIATVYSITEAFYRANGDWEPKTKVLAATSFNRARRWLLEPGAVLTKAEEAAVSDYLNHASFLPPHQQGHETERQLAGRQWLIEHSAPADSVTTANIEAFLARFEFNQRDPAKRVGPTTVVRYTQPLRACWAWAVARDDISATKDPWPAVKVRRKAKGGKIRSGGPGNPLAVDADLVLSMEQAMELASACGGGAWGGVVECYVLVMAMCGLRPNEAVGLLWEDVDLPDGAGSGWLTVRRSRRRVAARWLDPEEDPEWGPLKDRDIADTRRVPVHPTLCVRLREHRELYVLGPDGLVFHRNGRPFDLSVFSEDVWNDARASLFPPRADLPLDDPRQPKLSRLRRHDLRHAACSWWLRSGVDATVCQRWSGHKTLSVFLDVYQGVAPGREQDGVLLLEHSLPAESE